ncbi:hypothetical protein Tco_0519035 [Tanacetum coccineum]
MKRAGKDFSGRITPLFDTMMVQPVEEMGEDSDNPTDSTPIPIIDQPSSSSQPKKDKLSKKVQRQEAEVPQDEVEHEESVPTPSSDPQPSGEDSMKLTDLMVLCTKLQSQVLDLQKAKDAQAKEIDALKKRIQRLERRKISRPTGLKRLRKVGMSRRVESSTDHKSLGVPEDASKQGMSIKDIYADVDVSLVDETQERQDDDLIFDTGVLDDVEMPVEAKVDGKDEQSTKKLDDSTAGEAVTTDGDDSVTTTTRPNDRGVSSTSQVSSEFYKRHNLQVLKIKEKRLQSKEREELTDEEKAKLFMELMEKRRKHFAALRAQEKRNRPPTKAQKRTQMSTYLKHMGGYTYKQLKGKSFDEIQKLFDKEMKRVNTFVAMGSEVQESKEKKEEGREETTKGSRKKMLRRKRAGKEQQQESSKKQKVEEEKESDTVDEYDEAELKKLLVIKKDEDIAIDAIPLATKLPVIIDYKLHKEGMLVHYQLIRADGSSKRYSSMIRMLQGIDREDLEALWRIVKAKYGDTRPKNEFERVLWGDLKVMFEPDKRSDVWRILQGFTELTSQNGKGCHYCSLAKTEQTVTSKDSIHENLNKSTSLGNCSVVVPGAKDTINGDGNAQTRFEITSKQSNDPPLSRGYTLGSGEDSMKFLELMEFCTQMFFLMLSSVFNLNPAKLNLMLSDFNILPVFGFCCIRLCNAPSVAEMHNVVASWKNLKKVMGFAEIIGFPKAFCSLCPLTVKCQSSMAFFDHMSGNKSEVLTVLNTSFDAMVETLRWRSQILDVPRFSKFFIINTGFLIYKKQRMLKHKEIAALKKRIQRLERKKLSRPTGLKRLRKVGMSRRVESSEDQESLGAPEDASKQGRSIEDIDVDVDVSLVDKTQERQDDNLMFDTRVLEDDEMHVEAKVGREDEQSTKPNDSTAGEAVTTASVEDSVGFPQLLHTTLQYPK